MKTLKFFMLILIISNYTFSQINNPIKQESNIRKTPILNIADQNSVKCTEVIISNNSIKIKQEKLAYNEGLNKKRNASTYNKDEIDLILKFNYPIPAFTMVGQDTFYTTGINAHFIDNYTAKAFVRKGKYNVFTFFGGDSSLLLMPARIVYKENVLIDSLNDTLFINSSEANHVVLYRGVDVQGNLIIENKNSFRSLICKFLGAVNGSGLSVDYYYYPFDGFYTSNMIDSSFIYCTEFINELNINSKILKLNHQPITEIDSNIELINHPRDYISQIIEINQPESNLRDVYFNIIDHYILPIDTLLFDNTNNKYVLLYLTPNPDELYENSIAYNYNFNYPYLTSFKVVNNKVTIFDYFTPTSDLYLSNAGDTLILGKGLMYNKNQFYNNQVDSFYIKISPQLFYQMKDNYSSELSGSVFNLYNNSGQLLKSTNIGWDVTQKYYTSPGKYTVQFIDTNYFVSGKRGKAKMVNYFDLSLPDALPPVFNALQIRNTKGKPCELLKTNEQATIHFSLADTYFDNYRNIYYQAVVPDSTKIFVKQYQSKEWIGIDYNFITEDTIVYGSDGGYYIVAQMPEAFTSLDSSAIDLRVEFQDSSGNKTDFSLEPAVGVGRFKFPYSMPLTKVDSFSIRQDSILIVSSENSVLLNDSCREEFGLTAKLISQPLHGNIDFNNDGSFIYIPETNYYGNDYFLYQALNGGIIPSYNQTVVIYVKNMSSIKENWIINADILQIYPNPFSTNTTINFSLKENTNVQLSIYDLYGARCAILINEDKSKGKYQVKWTDLGLLSAGVYYCCLKTEYSIIVQKVFLIK